MARRRGERVPVFVNLTNGLKYGFQTQKTTFGSHGKELGQTAYTTQTGVFFGANSPKPNRATKIFATGSESSFCSAAKEAALKKAEWVITKKSSRRGIKSAGITRTVYVDMPGDYKYAWNLTAAEFDLAPILGFQQATGSMPDLVWGSYPKPPRASKQTPDGRVSTFCKPQGTVIDKAVAAGFSVSAIDYDLIPNA
ncbi:hypothetical protein BST81_13750 [Leptolyngbya sp. 'hensonii']|uniref:hypothetical protein n=1 Tax=Leptolyngbya sp. 'hensonii' TaxID=1922337 RepID=UPI00094F92C9|nr:hypothetical protein [Leptolyngbya sp. 'hensonii']OLP18084.1 hypothetical protein BST81_13750 [Leptolyngbya sp. 'hensonii']